MSGGTACKCEEASKPIAERKWRVHTYRTNYSAFNGYKATRSDYSGLECDRCGMSWRTKAAYVEQLVVRSR